VRGGGFGLGIGPEGLLARELGRRFGLDRVAVPRLVEEGLVVGFFVDGDLIDGISIERVLVERFEELLLGCCDGLSVERGDLGRGLGLLGGALGLGGENRAIAGGLCVTLGDGGGNAAGAGWCGG
jgi:hypothetical protein